MPRKLRVEVEGGVHHVFARGDNRRLIYLDDADRRLYLSMLGHVVHAKGWHCLAYCLMPNHVHLLVETPQPNLASGMQRLQSAYAQIFNRRHGGCGHVFQGRYGSVHVQSDQQLWAVVAYIARNPVEAGLCGHPGEWAWSSHHAVLGGPAPSWLAVPRLLARLPAASAGPRELYAELLGVRLC